MDEIVKQVIASVASTLLAGVLGQWVLKKNSEDGQPSGSQLIWVRGLALVIGVAVFLALWLPKPPSANLPMLQSIECNPPTAKNGDNIALVVNLDRPAPKGGVSVDLASKDPAILNVPGSVTVSQGQTFATSYAQVVGVPNYRLPVKVQASYKNATVETQVNVVGSSPENSNKQSRSNHKAADIDVAANNPAELHSPALDARPFPQPKTKTATSGSTATPPPSKPASLDPELVSRLEEAQGRLAAEKSFWERNKPPSGNLRPEITSQIFAADSASKRCDRAEQSVDASGLANCIDALNDHLNQLRIQH